MLAKTTPYKLLYNGFMKIFCEKCHEDISADVDKHFEQFEIGQVICSKCHEKQRRYLSEADLLFYFGVSSIFYLLLFIVLSQLLKQLGINALTIAIILVILAGAFFFQKDLSRRQYREAYFKKTTRYTRFNEDKQAVGKSLKLQFMAFIVIALMFGTNPELSLAFILFGLAFIFIIFLKLFLLIKNGRG